MSESDEGTPGISFPRNDIIGHPGGRNGNPGLLAQSPFGVTATSRDMIENKVGFR